MATYRVQRLFSKWEEYNDWAARFQHRHPKLNGKSREEALEETLRTGKFDGSKAKKFVRDHTLFGAALEGTVGALVGKSIGGKKGAVIGGLSGAALGAGIGYGSAKLGNRFNAKRGRHKDKKVAGYRADRWLDNMAVVDGKMSEEEFNRKWKWNRERDFSKKENKDTTLLGAGVGLGIGGTIAGDMITKKSGQYLKNSNLTAADSAEIKKKLISKAKEQGIKVIEDKGLNNSAYMGSRSGKVIKKGISKYLKILKKKDPEKAREALNKIKSGIEETTGSKKFLGALGKDAIITGKGTLSEADVLAHELGHAQYYGKGRSKSILGKAAHATMPISKVSMSKIGVLGSFGYGMKSGYDNEKKKQKGEKTSTIDKIKSVAIPAALVAPVLIGEGKASLRGLKMMKKSGASKELMSQSRKRLGAAYGTYTGQALKPVVSGGAGDLVGRGIAKLDKKEEKD